MSAPTPAPAGNALQATFTTADSAGNTANYIAVPADYADGPTGEYPTGVQFLKIEADHTIAGGTATIEFVLTDGTVVYDTETVAITAGTRRTGPAGALGNYICTCVGSKSGTNKLDLFGASGKAIRTPGDRYWMYGLTVISGGSVVVRVLPGYAI